MSAVLDFKTKTIIRPKVNPSLEGKFMVGIDV